MSFPFTFARVTFTAEPPIPLRSAHAATGPAPDTPHPAFGALASGSAGGRKGAFPRVRPATLAGPGTPCVRRRGWR
jgi:hypothetical protein